MVKNVQTHLYDLPVRGTRFVAHSVKYVNIRFFGGENDLPGKSYILIKQAQMMCKKVI